MAEIYYDKLLGEGSFGRVYSGEILNMDSPQREIALKRVRHVAEAPELCPLLRHEACALVRLQGHPSIPKVFAFGASQYYEYLAFQRLGEDLHSYFTDSAQPLSLGNVVSIAYQMLDVLEHTHARGIVHCDIKPSNMMFDVGGPSARIYLIDFGVCRTYKDPSMGQHRPDKPMPYHRGNTYFASLNGHRMHTPSRRDDLESLAYVLIWLLRGGELPWRPLQSAEVYAIKSRSSGAQLCPDGGWPPVVFGEFLDYCRGLQYAETPDYAFWRERFAGAVDGFTAEFDARDKHGPVAHKAPAASELTLLADSSGSAGWEVFKGGWQEYEPLTEYECVWSLSPEDLLASDEAEEVMRGTARLSAVPRADRSYVDDSCPPEALLPSCN